MFDFSVFVQSLSMLKRRIEKKPVNFNYSSTLT